ncbi:hypothetical protein Tco_0637564 [Tanacetum coccineum]
MVWRSASLRYETSEKKVNEVDFISQRVELVSRVSATMTKMDYKMVMREIEDVLLDEIERSLDDGLSKTLMMKERRITR